MTSHSGNSPSFFARTNFRNKGIPVGIKQADRLSHIYVIGKTGVIASQAVVPTDYAIRT
jgi:hypothetical protein